MPLAGDITDEAHRHDLTAAAFELGGLDLVVNNASTLGATPLPTLADYPLDELRGAFEVNVVAPLALVQDALPLLLEAPSPASSTSPRMPPSRPTRAGAATAPARRRSTT